MRNALRAALRTALRAALLALLLALAFESAVAQSPPPWTESILGTEDDTATPDGEDQQLTVAELRAELDSIDSEVEALRAAAATQTAAVDEAGEAEAPQTAAEASRLRSLEKTRSLLNQQIDELNRAEDLAQAQDDLEALERDGVVALVDHDPPFGFDDLDSVLARLEASKARRALLADTVADGGESLEEAEKRLRQMEQARRQARERAESAPTGERAQAEASLENHRQTARLAHEEVAQLRLQLANDRLELEQVQQREDFLQQGVQWVRGRLQASDDALQTHLAQLLDQQEALRGELDKLRQETQREESRLLRAQNEGRTGDTEVARTALDLLDHRQRLLEERIDRRDLQADLWRQRHRLAASPAIDEKAREEIQSAVARDLAELEREQRLLKARLQDLRAAESRVADQLLNDPNAAEGPSLRRRESLLQEQAAFVDAQLSDISDALTLARRAASEAAAESLNAGEMVSGVWRQLVKFWRYEITVVEDRSITLGMVVLALLLLIAGYLASKRISQALGRVLQRRFGLSGGAAAALQNIAFYLMVIAFLLWAMQLVSIPLTVFTFLGGVLAIGIGFGSQNVVNNFISGLILLVERPVKVGDLVEVDGTVGSVESIGLRSARIRSGDNTHIIVPNSTFLEQKVLNWTISDDLVRTQVDVGIAYGSPTREAEKLIKQALDEEPVVIQNMPKEVHFVEFGDNALHFRAYFWIRVRVSLDRQRAGSAIRFRIDELFAKAGIVIAFPQRDVHLDTLSPLQVRLLDRDEKDSP